MRPGRELPRRIRGKRSWNLLLAPRKEHTGFLIISPRCEAQGGEGEGELKKLSAIRSKMGPETYL